MLSANYLAACRGQGAGLTTGRTSADKAAANEELCEEKLMVMCVPESGLEDTIRVTTANNLLNPWLKFTCPVSSPKCCVWAGVRDELLH